MYQVRLKGRLFRGVVVRLIRAHDLDYVDHGVRITGILVALDEQECDVTELAGLSGAGAVLMDHELDGPVVRLTRP